MTKFNTVIAKKIIRLKKRGLTQQEIAKKVGISEMTLYTWLKEGREYKDQSKYYSLFLNFELIKKMEKDAEERKNFKPETEEEFYQHYYDDPAYFTSLYSYCKNHIFYSEKDILNFYKHTLLDGARKPYLTLYDIYKLEKEELEKGNHIKKIFKEEELDMLYEDFCINYPKKIIYKK